VNGGVARDFSDMSHSDDRPAIEEYPIGSADDFIELLQPTNNLWLPDSGAWIFRGQRDACWSLLSTAFRFNPLPVWFFGADRQVGLCATNSYQVQAEHYLVIAFAHRLDDQGLRIPGADPIPRTTWAKERGELRELISTDNFQFPMPVDELGDSTAPRGHALWGTATLRFSRQ
jgi:hypothetical protein